MKDNSKWMELSKKLRKLHHSTKNGLFIFLLCQLIVDVLELNGFGVIAVCHTAKSHPGTFSETG